MINNLYDTHALAERIIARREMLEYTKYDVADNAELSPTYIYQLEACKIASPGIENLVRVAYALGTTPEWLIFGREI